MKKPRYTIYLEQYGFYWSFKPAELVAILEEAVKGDGSFNLPVKNELKGRPNHIQKDVTEFYSYDKNKPLYRLLDADKKELQDTIDEIKEKYL